MVNYGKAAKVGLVSLMLGATACMPYRSIQIEGTKLNPGTVDGIVSTYKIELGKKPSFGERFLPWNRLIINPEFFSKFAEATERVLCQEGGVYNVTHSAMGRELAEKMHRAACVYHNRRDMSDLLEETSVKERKSLIYQLGNTLRSKITDYAISVEERKKGFTPELQWAARTTRDTVFTGLVFSVLAAIAGADAGLSITPPIPVEEAKDYLDRKKNEDEEKKNEPPKEFSVVKTD